MRACEQRGGQGPGRALPAVSPRALCGRTVIRADRTLRTRERPTLAHTRDTNLVATALLNEA